MMADIIYSENGEKWVIADDRAEAQAHLEAEWGDDYKLRDDGWMHDVGWDEDAFESQEEFEEETGATTYWESCLPPTDSAPTAVCKRVFLLVAQDEHREAAQVQKDGPV